MRGYVPMHARKRHYIGDHRAFRAWRRSDYVAMVVFLLAVTYIIGGVTSPVGASTMRAWHECKRVAPGISVCWTRKPPTLFEIQCLTPPHGPMRCEYRSK